MRPESWPGGCQITVHGEVKPKEDILNGLFRETREELGEIGWWAIQQESFRLQSSGSIAGRLKLLWEDRNDEKTVASYGLHFEEPFILKALRITASSGGIRLLRQHEIAEIKDLRDFKKDEGVTDRRIVAMFPDEARVVAEAMRRAYSGS